MKQAVNPISLTQFAGSVAEALDLPAPKQSEGAIPWLGELLRAYAGGPFDRALIYNPDAIAMWLYRKYRAWFADVEKHTQVALPLRSVMPSVTPVCFGTMYTGASPQVHGIQKYDKPVIRVDSLFDALARAGKRVAIVAVEGSSLSRIFNERDVDYFFLPYDNEVRDKALELIQADGHDLITVYTQAYDDQMHLTGPESPQSLEALQSQIAIFDALVEQVGRCWTGHNTLYSFSPDHGVHLEESGHGNHGLDIPEDLNIMHFFGVRAKLE